eukprot:6385126-Alexandrium_andersonii.AAC.1
MSKPAPLDRLARPRPARGQPCSKSRPWAPQARCSFPLRIGCRALRGTDPLGRRRAPRAA